MATKLLEPFTREIVGGKEPNDQQRNFLFLPLPILRDFTNIESIVTDDYIMKYAKQPTKREIDETIEKRHLQMGQLNKWKHWKLSKLKFCLPHIGTEDANICLELKERQTDERDFSEHEKQFAYLPLAILYSATNIRQLFSDIKSARKLDALIRKIHSQMSSTVWAPELLDLRFIDTTSNGCNAIEQDENAAVVKPKPRTTRSASVKTTALENNPNIEPVTRPLGKRKIPNQDAPHSNPKKSVASKTRGKAKLVQFKEAKVILEDDSKKPHASKVDVGIEHGSNATKTAIDKEPKNPAGPSERPEDSDNELAQLAETQRYDAGQQRDLYSPSDFQYEILQLNFEDFVNKTNIKDIVYKEFRKQNNDACTCQLDVEMNSRLHFFYNFRTRTTEWHSNGIKNLAFLELECEEDSIVPKLDFNNVNHDEIDEWIKRHNPSDLIETKDKSVSTSDLQQTIQRNAAEDHDTNHHFAGNIAEDWSTSQDDDNETPLQNNDNDSVLIETATVIASDLPVTVIEQEPNATQCPVIINQTPQTMASPVASQQNDVQNARESVNICDIKEEDSDGLSEISLETIDASPDFPSEGELQKIIEGTDIQGIDELQMMLTIPTQDELVGILLGL